MKILFFIDGLKSGGKERRLSELLNYLRIVRQDFHVALIHKELFFCKDLLAEGNLTFIEKKNKKSIKPFIEFYNLCKVYKPDIIHTWSNDVAFYSLPSVIIQQVFMVNSQITDAPKKISKSSLLFWVSKINFFFSDVILSNSFAGLKGYNAPLKKSKVIYNGLNLMRFDFGQIGKLEFKFNLGIQSEFMIVMVGSFSANKDFATFFKVAEFILEKRTDISFVAVGDGPDKHKFNKYLKYDKIFLLGKRVDVEKILKVADIGVLLSPNGEGCSNSILEYMASQLPVLANDAGGTKEIVLDGENGYLLKKIDIVEISAKIELLLSDEVLRSKMGENGKKYVYTNHSIERMGQSFLEVYNTVSSSVISRVNTF